MKLVEYIYGAKSLEASNCYFLMGIYFKEIFHYHKAIACFVKAATLREKNGGDCYINLGHIYLKQKQLEKSVSMLMMAARMKEEESGPASESVARIH